MNRLHGECDGCCTVHFNISSMSKPEMDKSSVASLRFNGKPLHFAAWKCELVIHLKALSEQRALEELQHKRAKPLSRGSLDEPVHVVWRLVEKQYSLSNAAGVVGLVGQFMKIVNSDFKSVGQLFQDLNSVRSQINVNSREALHTHMLSSQLMLVMVLGALPRHMWGSLVEFTPEAFTLENVSEKLTNIFGNQSKASIMELGNGKTVNHVEAAPTKQNGSVLGKRKAQSAPANDRHYNQGIMKCHYCAGNFNGMNNTGPHKLLDCPKRALTGQLEYTDATFGQVA
eukprot:jgi/Phyca11/15663/fgenesh1_pg.PHYCAscaffold_15_\